jgi:hypothetical protein
VRAEDDACLPSHVIPELPTAQASSTNRGAHVASHLPPRVAHPPTDPHTDPHTAEHLSFAADESGLGRHPVALSMKAFLDKHCAASKVRGRERCTLSCVPVCVFRRGTLRARASPPCADRATRLHFPASACLYLRVPVRTCACMSSPYGHGRPTATVGACVRWRCPYPAAWIPWPSPSCWRSSGRTTGVCVCVRVRVCVSCIMRPRPNQFTTIMQSMVAWSLSDAYV